MERAIASLVEAGLSPQDAFDTYSTVSVHIRGSVVLQRLSEKNRASDAEGPSDFQEAVVIDPAVTPLLAEANRQGHRVGAADDANFEYGLNCILDHAERLIEKNTKSARHRASAKAR
nr:transcriptional regulator [Mycolicibacter nonchromogenicus]